VTASRVALSFSGGIALGAFQAGVWEACDEASLRPDWLLGASVGAVTAVLLAGGPLASAKARLDRFWAGLADEPLVMGGFWPGQVPPFGPLRRAASDAAIAQTLLLGRAGAFRPNPMPSEEAPGLYELAPLRRTLREIVDFEALHAPGAPRVTLVASDLLAGERVVFDTGRGDRIGVEEVIASCSLPPLFPPVVRQGRLLGDGGLTGNLPLSPPLAEPGAEEVLCIAAELFARQGSAPHSLSAAAARAGDIVFGSRSRDEIAAEARAHALRQALRRHAPAEPLAAGPRRVTVLLLGERVDPDDAGVLKPFDFSKGAIASRRAGGKAAAQAALALPRAGDDAFVLHEATAPAGSPRYVPARDVSAAG
jgi:NTE family protein